MKKTLKVLLIVAFMAVMALVLTGCGNKLVATKTTEEEGIDGGTIKYEEKMEIAFKNDKVDSVEYTMTFEDDTTASTYGAFFKMMLPETEIKGKKVIVKMDASTFKEQYGESAEDAMTKEEVKKELESEGYKVK